LIRVTRRVIVEIFLTTTKLILLDLAYLLKKYIAMSLSH